MFLNNDFSADYICENAYTVDDNKLVYLHKFHSLSFIHAIIVLLHKQMWVLSSKIGSMLEC